MATTAASVKPLSTPESFSCGGLAACIAVTASNPAEVAKTRMQLQGELMKGGGPKVYRNVLDVLSKTWFNEGIRGVQRGLAPAYVYQILLNGSRLGFYEPFRRSFNQLVGRRADEQFVVTSMGAGAASGVVGACLGNPLFLIKTRMQAYSPALPVGTQRHYKSSISALASLYRGEGVFGFARGMDAAILRASMGSSVQLPSYLWAKARLVESGYFREGSSVTFLTSSAISGATVCLVMQPADTTLTRMYNQPTTRLPDGRTIGTLYKNPFDCLLKTFRAEGIFGWYKGEHLLQSLLGGSTDPSNNRIHCPLSPNSTPYNHYPHDE